MKTRKRSIPTRRAAGFTLLELILAMTITAVVSAALFTGLSGTFKTRSFAEDHLAAREATRFTVEVLRADLQCIPPAGGRIRGVFIGEDLTGRDDADTDTLLYVTANPALKSDQDVADLRQVELRLLDSDQDPDHYVLARLIRGNLLAVVEPEPTVQVLARRVVSMNLEYFDGTEWLDEWDSTLLENALPPAVRLTLVVAPELNRSPDEKDEEAIERTYLTATQIIRLPSAEEPEGLGLDLLGF